MAYAFPTLFPKFKREADAPLTPKETMTSGFRNAIASQGLTNVENADIQYDPLPEFDYELKAQNLESQAVNLRARLQQQRFQNTLNQVAASSRRQNNGINNWFDRNIGAGGGGKTDPMFRSFKNPSLEFQAYAKAISGQESGGDYGVTNDTSGAMGRYQILPSNIGGGGWDERVLGHSISNAFFLSHPKVQDRIALHMMQGMFNAHGVRGAASEWYSGDPNNWKSTSPQSGGPSIRQYVNDVYSRYRKILPHLQARQAAFTAAAGKSTGLRGLGDPLKGKGNWGFGDEGDWGHRSIGQGFHTGIDFDVNTGTPVYAAQSGKVSTANYDSGYGNQIFINGANKSQTRYQHLSRFAGGLKPGQTVKKGQLIGYSGNTGSYSQGEHLHFETLRHLPNTGRFDSRRIEQGWTSVNPFRFFRRYNPHHD